MINSRFGLQKWMRPIATAIVCVASAMSLQGCFEMFVGSAVVGTFAASDRRTLGAQTEDRSIMIKGEMRASDVVGERGHVNVASFNRKVLLTGEVQDEQMKAAVEREITGIEGVKSVANELEIAGPSSFTSRASDSLITSKVAASFFDAKDLFANSFKVVTEHGTVFLMGRVTPREGDRAAEIASGISGVQRVVKVFEYISEDDLKRLTNAPQPTQSR